MSRAKDSSAGRPTASAGMLGGAADASVAGLRYARLQTIFAGAGVLLSAVLSAAGLWIAWQLSEANDRARAAEVEAARRARLEDNARASAVACLDLAIRIKEATADERARADYTTIRREVANRCKEASINLDADELSPDELDRQVTGALLRAFFGLSKEAGNENAGSR